MILQYSHIVYNRGTLTNICVLNKTHISKSDCVFQHRGLDSCKCYTYDDGIKVNKSFCEFLMCG